MCGKHKMKKPEDAACYIVATWPACFKGKKLLTNDKLFSKEPTTAMEGHCQFWQHFKPLRMKAKLSAPSRQHNSKSTDAAFVSSESVCVCDVALAARSVPLR